MSEPLLLTESAPARDAQPEAGLGAALGAAFNTRGKMNTEFPDGTVVNCRGRTGQIVRPAVKPNCYDVLLHEKQVELQHLVNANMVDAAIKRDSRVVYKHGTVFENAIVEKVDRSFEPPVVYIRVLLRNVPAKEISAVK